MNCENCGAVLEVYSTEDLGRFIIKTVGCSNCGAIWSLEYRLDEKRRVN